MGRVHSALLLIILSQFDGLSMWTDHQGVVHVVASAEAPVGATPLEGGGYSVIDGDGRPTVLADGGTRTDDVTWWRARFQHARETVSASQALERAAAQDIREAEQELCVSATAKSDAKVRVVSAQRTVVSVSSSQGLRNVAVGPGVAVVVEDRDENTARQCQRGSAPSAMVLALQQRRSEREQAERALRRLEQEALAEHVPVRDWY
jgi:hypothetical protein